MRNCLPLYVPGADSAERGAKVQLRGANGTLKPEPLSPVLDGLRFGVPANDIGGVNLVDPTPPLPQSQSRSALIIVASAACLTLLFSVQDAMRRTANGVPVDWPRVIAINALDWVVWGLLVPFIFIVGRHIRLDASGRRAARIAGWLLLAVAFCAVQSTLTGLVVRFTNPAFFGMEPPPGASQRPLGMFLLGWGFATSSLNLLIFGMTAGVFHAALYYRDLRARQLYEADLQARLARAELNVLRMQLQPHFFFNALHTVSALMVTDVPTAQRVISALGDLLRASLDHTARQEISLRDEVTFVTRFLDIQRARFRNRLSVELNVPDTLLDALVPSLVLQPLVENAIRYGIEPNAAGGHVWIGAARHELELILTVRDDGPGAGASNGAGVGLANIEARLHQLYGVAGTFQAGRNSDGHFTVTLRLPYHTDATLFPAAAKRP